MQYPPIVIININDMTQISFAFNLSETNNNNIGTVLPATELCRPYYLIYSKLVIASIINVLKGFRFFLNQNSI